MDTRTQTPGPPMAGEPTDLYEAGAAPARFGGGSTPRPAAAEEETLVLDARAGLSPSQMVERKLLRLLNGKPLPLDRLGPAAGRRAARYP